MILTVINPVSGNNKSIQIWEKIILPRLLEVIDKEDDFHTFISNFEGHEKMIPTIYKIEDYDFVIVIGGDGTLSNIIKGIMKSPYKNKIFQVPFVLVPAGSGNGFATSLCINSIYDSVKIMEKLYLNKSDSNYSSSLVSSVPIWNIKFDKSGYSMPAFLNLTWSTIADIDLNTENNRWMGKYRFYYGILKYLLFGGTKEGQLKYILKDSNEIKTINGNFSLFCATNAPWLSDDFLICPNSEVEEPVIDLVYSIDTPNIVNRSRNLYHLAIGDHIEKCEKIIHEKVSWFSINVDKEDLISVDGEFCAPTGFPIEVSVLNNHIKLGNFNDLKKDKYSI
jgi:diacylglycerol kinase (ATP)